MRGAVAALAPFAMLLAAAPAAAWPPPLPGAPAPTPPTDAELATIVDRAFDRMIDGVVIRGTDRHGRVLFRVTRVYRGGLRNGQVVALTPGPSLRSMNPCPGMVPDFVPLLSRGMHGVIGWRDADRAQFIDDALLAAMMSAGYVEPSPHLPPRDNPK